MPAKIILSPRVRKSWKLPLIGGSRSKQRENKKPKHVRV